MLTGSKLQLSCHHCCQVERGITGNAPSFACQPSGKACAQAAAAAAAAAGGAAEETQLLLHVAVLEGLLPSRAVRPGLQRNQQHSKRQELLLLLCECADPC